MVAPSVFSAAAIPSLTSLKGSTSKFSLTMFFLRLYLSLFTAGENESGITIQYCIIVQFNSMQYEDLGPLVGMRSLYKAEVIEPVGH